jgi:DNA-binding NtrC family response regulator
MSLRITPDAMNLLMKHNYKGNVRELENILEQAAITADNDVIDTEHLTVNSGKNFLDDCLGVVDGLSLKELEKKYIIKVLEKTNGNKKKASELLGIDRKTLYNKINEFEIKND